MVSVWLPQAGSPGKRTARSLRRAVALAELPGAPRSVPMKDTTVIYNGACPVCSREIGLYRARAEGPVSFVDLNDTDLAVFELTRDEAARRLHVVEDGRLLVGVEAFRALWRATPGFRWLAAVAGLPGVRQAAGLLYDRVLAPALYRRHVKRMRRARA
jgi:predicted DCC family thiol-disulfide oxidoreductase YuxK